MQNFRTLGLIIKKVRDLFNLPDKYRKIIQCVPCPCIISYPCMEATYPYAIKTQRKARNAPRREHFVPKPLVGGFECLELVLYGIRELA